MIEKMVCQIGTLKAQSNIVPNGRGFAPLAIRKH